MPINHYVQPSDNDSNSAESESESLNNSSISSRRKIAKKKTTRRGHYNVANDESIAGATGARVNKPASGDRISDENKREFQMITRRAVKQARERAADERAAAVPQRAIASKMDEERPTRLIEVNAEADELATVRTEWIGGGRRSPDNAVYDVPTVKSKSSSKKKREKTLDLIGRNTAERTANVINTVKAKLEIAEGSKPKKKPSSRKLKPLRLQEPAKFVYHAMIDKNGMTTKATNQRRYIIIDSGSQVNLVKDEKILDMLRARKGSMSVRGFTSNVAKNLTIAAPLIHPFAEMEAFIDDTFPENIMSLELLENFFEVSIVRNEDLRYLSCINNLTGETVRCFRDPQAKNFYTYAWDDSPATTCFKISSTLQKAQGMGLSKTAAVRALQVEAVHKALSHVSCEILKKFFREGVFTDCDLTSADVDNFEKYIQCTGCSVGKKIREAAVMTDPPKPSESIGAMVHADVFNISSENKEFQTSNFLMTVDDYSGYCNIIPLSNATSAETVRGLKVVADIYKKAGHEIKKIRSDNGGGFIADATKKALDAMNVEIAQDETTQSLLAMAIEHEYCSAQSHVRVAERAIRHAKELFRATIYDLPYLLPNKLYSNAMIYVASSINLAINASNDVRCPWQLMHGEAPRSHDFLRSSFGQLVTTYNQLNPNRRADDAIRADVGIVVGRDNVRKGSYYVYDIHTMSTVSRHDITPIGWNQTLLNNFHKVNKLAGVKAGDSARFTYGDNKVSSLIDLQKKRKQVEDDARLIETDSAEDLKRHDARLAALTTYEYPTKSSTNDSKESKEEIEYREEVANVMSSFNISIKKSIEIVGVKATEDAALKELEALLRLEVFRFIDRDELSGLLRAGTNFITSQMLMKQKFDANNNFEKNKGRLIGHGNQQIFDEVFSTRAESPTININITFAGLAIAAKAGPKTDIEVIDIDNAYLNAKLKTPEYMYIGRDVAEILCRHHQEYETYLLSDGRLAVELQKALYGLRTAGRDWYNLITEVLESGGYVRSEVDKCLFIHHDKTQIFLYVDDLLVIGAAASIAALKTLLTNKFGSIKVKSGPKISYLGMAIERIDGHLHVHQRGYIENIAREYNCEDSSSKYPATTNILHHAGGHEDMTPIDCTKYLSLAMKLMFVAVRCRPDALFATTILAARCQHPTVEDYNRLLKIVRYLHGSKEQTLIFRSDTPINPRMYVDASFQTHRDAKGHSGFVLFLDEGSAGVMFKSKKQQCVSDSSAEAELISLHEGVRQLMWMTLVLEELGVVDTYPIKVYQDNQSTIKMAKDETVNFRGRSKFIDRKFFSIYQHVESGKIELVFVGTELMVADFFTKAIVGKQFEFLKSSIMGSPQV